MIIRANGCWTSNCGAQLTHKLLLKRDIYSDVKFVNDNSFSDIAEMAKYDYIILEACSVTINMEMMIANFLKKIKQINPSVHIFIYGCGAKNSKSLYYNLKEVDCIFKSQSSLINYFMNVFNPIIGKGHKIFTLTNHVLVKKGCNRFCSYCIVPYVRTPTYNRPIKSIINEIMFLKKHGFKKVQLAGLCILNWKDKGWVFADLLEKILVDMHVKVSIYEFHPKDINKRLIDLLCHQNMDNNISIPLQSGSDKLLKLMNRGYTVKLVENLYKQLIEKKYNINISTELMFGFPFETEKDFMMTTTLFYKYPFNKLSRIQVYPFSPRPFTKASKLPQINVKIIKARINRFCNSHMNLPIVEYGKFELDENRRIDYFNLLQSKGTKNKLQ
jgi:MiaB/RimO family radical SAM methylthiotransferase